MSFVILKGKPDINQSPVFICKELRAVETHICKYKIMIVPLYLRHGKNHLVSKKSCDHFTVSQPIRISIYITKSAGWNFLWTSILPFCDLQVWCLFVNLLLGWLFFRIASTVVLQMAYLVGSSKGILDCMFIKSTLQTVN